MSDPEAHSEPYQTSKMERFVNKLKRLLVVHFFADRSILDIWEGWEYAYVIYNITSVFAYWTKWKGKTYQ